MEITVIARHFDRSLRRTWNCRAVDTIGDLHVLVGEFDREVIHPELGIIRRGTLSYEFYWLDRWYNVFRFHEPDGELRNYYCNVNMPPSFDGRTLDYVDLDIDILVTPDMSTKILDLDEFETNCRRYQIPEDIRERAHQAVRDLLGMVQKRDFPFDT
ncbi:MAG: DUF402 domain-containing protein [Pyrinomonadaceae bacterium]